MIILQWIFELDKWKYFVNSKLFDHQCRYAYCVCNMYGHLATQIEIFCEMKQNCGKKKIGLDLMFVAQKTSFFSNSCRRWFSQKIFMLFAALSIMLYIFELIFTFLLPALEDCPHWSFGYGSNMDITHLKIRKELYVTSN